MTVPCPHCVQTLSIDYLDKIMDEMERNSSRFYEIQYLCPYSNCRSTITFSKDLYMYYIHDTVGGKSMIGGK